MPIPNKPPTNFIDAVEMRVTNAVRSVILNSVGNITLIRLRQEYQLYPEFVGISTRSQVIHSSVFYVASRESHLDLE